MTQGTKRLTGEAVREMLRLPVLESVIPRNVSMALLLGDATEKAQFKNVLGEVVGDVVDRQPGFADQQPDFSAARGTAEPAKREVFRRKAETDIGMDMDL
jgi:hypothetical protein